ncbi:hypothetical protein ACQUKI_11705 [Ralstonia pseudosolanacearum]|uniref:hypothetical protein n=1 Tax=Ralstonia pseudosolanacearum TaxID=1310165 RepID=UPI001FF78D74|nr:hypothetical protein [Ralstonia pseudosolanacearum]
MQTTPTPLSTELQAALERYKAVRAGFEQARDEAARIDADLQEHHKAAEAAEVEAQQARTDAAQLMRNTGSSMKDIRALKATERAAYTLAEDYRAIVAEFQTAHDEAAIKAGVARRDEDDAYLAVLRDYADMLMSEAAQLAAPLFRVIRVQELANAYAAAAPGGADWELFSDTARKAALSTLYGVIERSLADFEFDRTSDAVLQAAQRPTDLEGFKVISTAALHRDRVLRQQAIDAALSPSA